MSKIVRLQMAWMEIDPFFFQVLPLGLCLGSITFQIFQSSDILGASCVRQKALSFNRVPKGEEWGGVPDALELHKPRAFKAVLSQRIKRYGGVFRRFKAFSAFRPRENWGKRKEPR